MMERPGMGRPADTILALRSQSRKCSGDTAAFERFWAGLEHDLIGLIYASDLIDGAGTTLSATAKLCKAVFRGEDVDGQIDVDDAEYQQHIGHLQATCRKADLASVIVSRRQTICHAKALVYMIRKVVLEKQPLSEAVMLKTHRILHEGMDTRGKAGRYRGDEVEVAYNEVGEKKRSGMCIRASIVPAYMRLVLMHLADENREAEAGGDVDPYWLAARYMHRILMVHPFSDGNGLMSRIVLNVLLLKYAGHVVVLGRTHLDRNEYLRVVRRGRGHFDAEDMELGFREQTSHCAIARLVLADSKPSLEWIGDWVDWARRVGAKDSRVGAKDSRVGAKDSRVGARDSRVEAEGFEEWWSVETMEASDEWQVVLSGRDRNKF